MLGSGAGCAFMLCTRFVEIMKKDKNRNDETTKLLWTFETPPLLSLGLIFTYKDSIIQFFSLYRGQTLGCHPFPMDRPNDDSDHEDEGEDNRSNHQRPGHENCMVRMSLDFTLSFAP
jgi:hypothetical protein